VFNHFAASSNLSLENGSIQGANPMNRTAVLYALASAALFGASTPAAKLLIGSVQPAILAGLLYCGAGIGIAALRLIRAGAIPDASEVALGRSDWPWLAGAIGAGGVIGPLLLMTGLSRTEASAASLLLTLEGAATALIAWYIFHENFDRRIALGMFCLISGAAILSWSGTPTLDRILGPLRSQARALLGVWTTISRARSRWPTRYRSSSSRGFVPGPSIWRSASPWARSCPASRQPWSRQ
jgi:drug/metabolite transporter (DMT)-like permease